MSNDELIAKAREHLRAILDEHPLPELNENMFTSATISSVPMVAFAAKNREDVIEITLEEETGVLRDVAHVPHAPKQR